MRWNVLSAPHSLGGAKLGKEQDRAAWSVRAKYYRCDACLCELALCATAAPLHPCCLSDVSDLDAPVVTQI